jgi:GMP synthase-like glutamine amidotransferase
MNVHYFQHVSFEGPGYITTWLTEQGHNITATLFFERQYRLPDLSEIDALIVMGGPMSVYDDHLYPWLQEEKAFIEDAIEAGKKVLGICLGAQLAALCLGTFVPTALQKEIGWYPVQPAPEAVKIAPGISALLAEQPVVFHWHGDKFDIPYGVMNLHFRQQTVTRDLFIKTMCWVCSSMRNLRPEISN